MLRRKKLRGCRFGGTADQWLDERLLKVWAEFAIRENQHRSIYHRYKRSGWTRLARGKRRWHNSDHQIARIKVDNYSLGRSAERGLDACESSEFHCVQEQWRKDWCKKYPSLRLLALPRKEKREVRTPLHDFLGWRSRESPANQRLRQRYCPKLEQDIEIVHLRTCVNHVRSWMRRTISRLDLIERCYWKCFWGSKRGKLLGSHLRWWFKVGLWQVDCK